MEYIEHEVENSEGVSSGSTLAMKAAGDASETPKEDLNGSKLSHDIVVDSTQPSMGESDPPADSRPNRTRYKLAIPAANVPHSERSWVSPHGEVFSNPRQTTLKEHEKKFGVDFEVHHLLPEWLHDRLFIKRIFGSKTLAKEVDELCSVRYLADLWTLIFVVFIAPMTGLATLGSALLIDETVPIWFPYVGASFFILFVPMIALTIVFLDDSYTHLTEMDDKTLKWLALCFIVLCFICSPAYGTWAVASLPENAAVDENMGLYVGAYISCALTLPLWATTVLFIFEFATDANVRGDMFVNIVYTIVGLAIYGIVLGSMIHQVTVGELLWFPYFGVVGLLCVVPILCALVVGVAIYAAEEVIVTEYFISVEGVAIYGCFLVFMTVTDGIAWIMSSRNFSQPVEQLIDDQFLYGGAICFYVVAIATAVYFVVQFIYFLRD